MIKVAPAAKAGLRSMFGRRLRGSLERRRSRVERILSRPAAPRFLDSEELFSTLHARYPAREPYGYDPYRRWWRGIRCAPDLLQVAGLLKPGAQVLEVACGDGMTGQVIASFGHFVTLHDLEDWRDDRSQHLPWIQGDICTALPAEADQFDLIYSYNAFEHIGDPAAALAELARLCKPGGIIYLDFGPLHASAWGLHAYTALRMPYPQFLFSPEFVRRKVEELGLFDLGRTSTILQPLNGWKPGQFRQLWTDSGLKLVSSTAKSNLEHLSVVEEFPAAFQGRRLEYEDITVEQLAVTLSKPADLVIE